ncbi:pyroglutamyl-peptidase I family protein [Nocardia nova]|uniref:pyroglutamyl-peptidase I family protein n=1 Tax=Nocardia nova TaxID=37330 RepID=UPI0007A4689C|nr:peptidase C15 [Nocardia nova]
MIRALVTGFGSYTQETDNPSGALAQLLDGQTFDKIEVVGRVLPVDTIAVREVLTATIDAIRPKVIVATGVAPGRAAPALERVAINVRDFPIPDNQGQEPIDEPVELDGAAAYLSTLPNKAILRAWREAGIPGYLSNTAGTYLCNQTFYLARMLSEHTDARTGFVHIPVTPNRAAQSAMPPAPSMTLAQLERAVRLVVSVAARHRGPDLRIGGGAIS